MSISLYILSYFQYSGRFGGSELLHEAFHSAVGLFSVLHSHLLKEPANIPSSSDNTSSRSHRSIHEASSLWLELIEQVETLIELAGIHHETTTRTDLTTGSSSSRFTFLAALEAVKAALKIRMWHMQSSCQQTFLRNPSDEDFLRLESHRGLKDVDGAMQRLREKRLKISKSIEDQREIQKWGPAHSLASFLGQLQVLATKGGLAAHEAIERSLLLLLSSLSSPATALDLASSNRGLINNLLTTLSSTQLIESVPRRNHLNGTRRSNNPMKDLGLDSLWLSDLIHILRPVIYTILLRKFGRGSWKPWLVSLAIDLWSWRLRESGRASLSNLVALQSPAPSPQTYHLSSPPVKSLAAAHSTPASISSSSLLSLALTRGLSDRLVVSVGERQEVDARKALLLLYLLRPPFVDSSVKTPLQWLVDRTGLSRAPLISSLVEYGLDLLTTTTDYYTYYAGS